MAISVGKLTNAYEPMSDSPLSSSKTVQLMTFADNGWGKTRLAGTSPGKVLLLRPIIEVTSSILSDDKPRMRQVPLSDWASFDEAYEELRHNGKKWDWVWWDSVSGFNELGLDDLWDTIITEKPSRKRYGLDKGDYGINMQRMGRRIRELVTLSQTGAFNLGINAWVSDLAPSEDEERQRKLMPYIQGKQMASRACGFMHIVGFGDFTSKGTRVLRFMETDRYYAHTKFDEPGPGSFADKKYQLLNPTMPKLLEMIERSGGPKRNTRPQSTKRPRPRRIRR